MRTNTERILVLLLSIGAAGAAQARKQEEPTSQSVASPPKTTPPRQHSGGSLLSQAEAAFASGRFAAASQLAAGISDQDPAAAQARYLQGYALYKLGNRDQAARLLEQSLALSHSAQVAFMCGLVAFELHRWSEARRRLEPLVASKKEPWAAPAGELLSRARTQQEAEARALHVRAIQRAEEDLKARRYAEAKKAITKAEAAVPGHILNHYYRGYLAHQRGDLFEARRHLRRALAIKPHDPWSRYMLALSLKQDAPERRRLLARLSTDKTDPGLRRAASLAMKIPRTPRTGGLTIQLELGGGLDTRPGAGSVVTNPFYKPPPSPDRPPPPDRPPESTTSDEAAMALRGTMKLAFQRELAPGHHAGVGASFLEHAYGVGGEDLERTEIAGSIYYGWRSERLDLTATYVYGLHLLGHAPLMSLHDLGLNGGIQLRPWLRLSAGLLLRVRDMHDEAYDYLQALEPSGSLALDARWSVLTARASYHLLRSEADLATITLSERLNKKNELVTTIYHTEYTYWGHGPRLELELSLPWRLTLNASAWALWGSFDQPDQFVVEQDNAVIWEQERQDLMLLTGVELRRELGHGLAVVISFSSVDNLSSLDGADDTPVDQTYSQRMLLGSLRWRWALR